MKSYSFAPISACEYPTIKLLDHPYIWGGVQFCVNVSEKPYTPELEAAMAVHGIEWVHCPVSEEPGADWLPSFADALPRLYLALKEGKKMIVHCDLGNNRSRSLVEALYFAIEHEEFDDPYKDADNHLEYNCVQGHLPDLGEWERRIYAMTELYEKGELNNVRQMSRVLLSKSPAWAEGGIFTFDTKSNPMFKYTCLTPFYSELYDAVEDYRNGRPLGDRITIDDVEITVLDEWAWARSTQDEDGKWIDIDAPYIIVNGEKTRFIEDEGIEGFTPERGHEYRLKVRRIFITTQPEFCHYILLEQLEDTQTT